MMNANELIKLKQLLDNNIISQEEYEREKAKLMKTEKKKSVGTAIAAGIGGFFLCIYLLVFLVTCDDGESKNSGRSSQDSINVSETVPEEFSQDFPIFVSGKMHDSILSLPTLSLTITNNTDKNISAIKFYFSPVDVYGAEIEGLFVSNYFIFDDPIAAGATAKRECQMANSRIKEGDVYIYSIYFEDGTEWGNREAPASDIKKYGYKISVKY